MSVRYVVGLGSSGPLARRFTSAGLRALHDALLVRAESRLYLSAACGGVTLAPFVNAAALVETPLAPRALLGLLRALERAGGRVRGPRYGGRSLDLDLLWSEGPPLALAGLTVPHPRLRERAFALVPLLECLRRAGLAAPLPLVQAARRAGIADLTPLAP